MDSCTLFFIGKTDCRVVLVLEPECLTFVSFVMQEKESLQPGTVISRHPASARFHELLVEAGQLHDLKQSDYGRGSDPFANVRSSTEWGLPAWIGAMVRLNDKVRRLQSLATKGHLNNEAALDSFMDIAVYALIARVLFEGESQSQ